MEKWQRRWTIIYSYVDLVHRLGHFLSIADGRDMTFRWTRNTYTYIYIYIYIYTYEKCHFSSIAFDKGDGRDVHRILWNSPVRRLLWLFIHIFLSFFIYFSTHSFFIFAGDNGDGRHVHRRGGGLGSRPKKMYGERLGDGVEYHLMKPTPRR